MRKTLPPEENEFYEYPCYIARIHYQKRRWFRAQYPHHRFIVDELDNVNDIHAFNQFKKEGHVEHFQCYFRVVDLADDAMYALCTLTIQN